MRARVAAALAALVLLAGCGVFDSGPELPAEPLSPGSASATEAPEPELADFYSQQISWRGCRDGLQCGTLTVPLDYADPAGETIELSLLKVPATHDDRVGSLVVNPGGPGGSAIEYAANAETYFGEEIRAAFDIVGVDPRGVGTSTPIDCLDDEALDEFVAFDPDPDSLGEAREALQLLRDFGQGCLDLSGDLTRHVSTEEAARDMDVLRAALGEDRLAYFGASYGTFLGAQYADLFPERVGRLVLDGALDPSLSAIDRSLVQAEGFETALRAYVTNCVDDGDCFLGDSVEDGLARIRQLLDETDAAPLPTGSDRDLTQGLAVLGVWAPLYDQRSWPALDVGLQEAFSGTGRTLLSFADQYVGRGPDGFADNSTEALYAVNCLDDSEAVPLRRIPRLVPRFEEASPTFGRIFAFGLTACGSWPVQSGKGPEALRAEGADPILVVGTTRDPATPLAWAEALAEQLESGVLVRRDGDGHTGYNAGNSCVDDVVERYLVSGTVPEADVDC